MNRNILEKIAAWSTLCNTHYGWRAQDVVPPNQAKVSTKCPSFTWADSMEQSQLILCKSYLRCYIFQSGFCQAMLPWVHFTVGERMNANKFQQIMDKNATLFVKKLDVESYLLLQMIMMPNTLKICTEEPLEEHLLSSEDCIQNTQTSVISGGLLLWRIDKNPSNSWLLAKHFQAVRLG